MLEYASDVSRRRDVTILLNFLVILILGSVIIAALDSESWRRYARTCMHFRLDKFIQFCQIAPDFFNRVDRVCLLLLFLCLEEFCLFFHEFADFISFTKHVLVFDCSKIVGLFVVWH